MLGSVLASDFATLAARRLRPDPPGLNDATANPNGDHALQPNSDFVPDLLPKPAAVLVPVVQRREPTVLLTARATNLRHHSGQIAFPGGRMDPEDASPLDTALREAEEEIGLERRFVTPIGYLDAYLTTTNYLIAPVVGLVTPNFSLTLNPFEVADAFEVPLHVILDPERHELHSREWKGSLRHYYAISFNERYIWGVTAGIIRNLYERLHQP